jgi:AcrR family transcriptional regulator
MPTLLSDTTVSTFRYDCIIDGVPKIVDQEARRQHIADTVMRIIGTRGLEEATVRKVAAEAGVSAGAVQRCFATRAEMLRFALHHNNIRFTARVAARITDPADTATGLRVVIDEMLPFDEERRVITAAALALLAHATIDPAAGAVMREAYTHARRFFATSLDETAAMAIYALLSGLQGPLLVGAVTPEQAWSVIEIELARHGSASGCAAFRVADADADDQGAEVVRRPAR